ncbi:hypothetical protein QAD02_002390 [Eretmocerus hayati]|uniref:Uncharacterized protein n=1 Tax=Eretmocerus hayati TaxID=131215 RepID=A0ACC2NJP3_9HYME|nr:hypothetical protein QAD02_002390 [Eretmocerus hayati]
MAQLPPYHIVQFVTRGPEPKLKKVNVVATKWTRFDEEKGKLMTLYPADTPPFDETLSEAYMTHLQLLNPAPREWITWHVKVKSTAETLQEALRKCDELLNRNYKDSVLTLESDESVSGAEKRVLDKIRQNQFREMVSQIEERYNKATQNLPQQSVTRSQNFLGPGAKRIKVLKPTKNKSDSSHKSNRCESKEVSYVDPCGTDEDSVTSMAQNNHDSPSVLCASILDIPSSNGPLLHEAEKSKRHPEFNDKHSTRKGYSNTVVVEMVVNLSNEVQELQEDCKIIKQSLQNIGRILAKDGTNSAQFIGTVGQINGKFGLKIPFKTIDEFQKFDEIFMSDLKLFSAVTNTLQTGVDPNLTITRCLVTMLKMFLAKEVAIQFVARQATAGKFIMCDTNFYKRIEALIIERRAISKMATPDKEMKAVLSSVMSNAPSWYKVNTVQSKISSDGSVGKPTTATVHSAMGNSTFAPVAVEMVNLPTNQLPMAILNEHSGNDGQQNCTFQVGATEIVGIESDGQLVRIDESHSLALQQTLSVAGKSDSNDINGHATSSIQLSPGSSSHTSSPQCAKTTPEGKDCEIDDENASYYDGLCQSDSDKDDDLNNENYLKLFKSSFN